MRLPQLRKIFHTRSQDTANACVDMRRFHFQVAELQSSCDKCTVWAKVSVTKDVCFPVDMIDFAILLSRTKNPFQSFVKFLHYQLILC